MDIKQSGWADQRRIMLVVLVFGILPPLAALASVGGVGGSIPTTHYWGMATSYCHVPEPDVIFAGRFEGAPASPGVPVHWGKEENNSGLFVPRLASFRIDDVVLGPTELTGQLVSVRYAMIDYPDMGGGPTPAGLQPIGVMPYTDIPATVGGRRCLLLLRKIEDGPGDYQVAFNQEFMVAGEKPQVSGWADLTPMKRLEYEFASAVASPDPAVAYLATGSACQCDSQAIGPELIAALKKNLSSADVRLKAGTVAGLVRIGDLDTIYGVKDIAAQWLSDPQFARWVPVLAYALWQVRSRNAVPALVELSTSPNERLRFEATYALRHIGGRDAIAALAGRLYDESSETRYQAIQGLAQSLKPSEVGVKDWTGYAPAVSIYAKDPDTPVNNWKRWWEQKGNGKYPSVDSLVQKAALFRAERPWARTAQPAE
jgi:HEAT repeats